MNRSDLAGRLVRATVIVLTVLVLGACALPTGGESNGATTQSPPTVVRVAAAADLKFAMDEIARDLESSRPDLQLEVSYGSSGMFVQQLRNGAPFDLYLSADRRYPEQLVQAGLADESDLFTYAVGRLVVWAPSGSPVDARDGLDVVADPRVRKVAIANPAHAPYGVAATAAMERAGVAAAVQDKLVLGENVAQAAEFARSGNAEVGVFALSLAMSPSFEGRGVYAEVPLDSYPRIEQGGVVMAAAAHPDAARAVRDHLRSERAVATLKRFGFFLPGD